MSKETVGTIGAKPLCLRSNMTEAEFVKEVLMVYCHRQLISE
jgi:hypothetical protein